MAVQKEQQFTLWKYRKLCAQYEYDSPQQPPRVFTVRDVLSEFIYVLMQDNYLENPFNDAEEGDFTVGYMQMVIRDIGSMETNQDGYITEVKIGGNDAWYMLGHVFWDENSASASQKFWPELQCPDIVDKLWEDIYTEHIQELRWN